MAAAYDRRFVLVRGHVQAQGLNPPSLFLSINGKPGRWRGGPTPSGSDSPIIPDFPEMLAGATREVAIRCGGRAWGGRPAHYLKQFHPKYTSKEELDKKLKEAKFDRWGLLFLDKNSWHLNPELPVVTPWKTVTPANTPVWTLERNPYSIWVDTAQSASLYR
jgi:peptide/nickel transport system substrate-binding protein